MLTDDAIKSFARNQLGCLCPEEVFESIDCQSDVVLDDSLVLTHKIGIGGRLLVYVMALFDERSVQTVLPNLVSAGIEERNEKGFNRIRFVLLTRMPDEITRESNRVFKSLAKDDNVHLHVIHESDFPYKQVCNE